MMKAQHPRFTFRSLLVVALLIGVLVSDVYASERDENVNKISQILKSLYVTPIKVGVSNAYITITTRGLSAPERKDLQKLGSRFVSQSAKTRSFCFFRGPEGAQKRVLRLYMNAREIEVLGAFLPSVKELRSPIMAINLKVAGLTKKPHYLRLPVAAIKSQENGEDTLNELLNMARSGRVNLKASLKNKPGDDRPEEALATIKTDRGPLNFWVLKPDMLSSAQKNAVIFQTPRKNKFELPLTMFPDYKEVRASLSVHGVMRRTRSLRLPVNAPQNTGFFIEYESNKHELRSLGVTMGAVPLNAKGQALGEPLYVHWKASATVQEFVGKECDFIIRQSEPVGTTLYGRRFQTYYTGDEEEISRLLQYDPSTEDVGYKYPSDSVPGPGGVVR